MTVWLGLAGLGTFLFALAPTYSVALLGRILGGAGVGIVLVCAFSVIGLWFDSKHFGTITGLYAATGPLGGFFAAKPLNALVEAIGWRSAFSLIALWLLVTAIGSFLTIPETGARPATAGGFRTAWAGLLQAARLRNLWLVGVYTFVALGILSTMQGLWTVPFLTDVYQLSADEAAGILQAWSIGLFIALPAWGYLVDRITHTHKWTMIASVGLHALPWIFLALAPASWPVGALFALFLYLALTNGCWMPSYALVRLTSPPMVAGSALGLLNFAFFLGAATFQQISGVILAWETPGTTQSAAAPYQILFGFFAVSLGLAAIALATSREKPPAAAVQ